MSSRRWVYIVDDNSDMRQSTQLLLETAGFEAKSFASGDDFLDRAGDLAPGIVLADLRMPGMDGLQLIDRLCERHTHLSCILITGHAEIEIAVSAIKKGAKDLLEKPFSEDCLFSILEREFQNFESSQDELDVSANAKSRINRLTEREHQVLEGLVNGLSNKLIAHALGISVRTVEMHRANLMDRLQCRNLAEVLVLAMDADLKPSRGKTS